MMTTETGNINTNLIFSSDAFAPNKHAAYSNRTERNGGGHGKATDDDQLRTGVRISGEKGVRISGCTGVRISSRSGVRISGRARGVRISRALASHRADTPARDEERSDVPPLPREPRYEASGASARAPHRR
ncbi:hypothetical protein SAMN04487905_10678 [Actinopolyspora xinjiangensis]|uniref:Uncharacterized protein n=1 Tax=Actinopolyspora xinjiangensis TaxID=405564 RepID=A0A1H0U6E1_9ACTN|nr:hypothetical protein SAMN04487905_10678 [Actinopolyspora xinjiangensis]